MDKIRWYHEAFVLIDEGFLFFCNPVKGGMQYTVAYSDGGILVASHVIDNVLLQNSFGTAEMRSVWDEKNRLQKQLDVERALAEAEGELGVIPPAAASAIAAAADGTRFDLQKLAQEGLTTKHSLMATIHQLQRLAGAAGEFVHYGATTQDIVDTGTVLQLKEAHAIILRDLKALLSRVATAARTYQALPMAGRTHGVQALPITFGFKLSILLCELGRHLERFGELEPRVFAGVLCGAVGTYASFNGKGTEIEARVMNKLGLAVPEICWHASRDRFAEYASVAALLSGTLGKIGHEFYCLMATEIDEVEEPFSKGTIGSSTMPQKRNPALLEGLASLTRPVFYSAALVREAMLMEHERDAMAWRAEWIALPELCIYLASQLRSALALFDGVLVKPENMRKNLALSGGLITAEKVMFELGKFVGKQTAHAVVYEIAMAAQEQGLAFAELLKRDERIRQHFSEAQIEGLMNPANYLGEAIAKVEQVLTLAQEKGWTAAQ